MVCERVRSLVPRASTHQTYMLDFSKLNLNNTSVKKCYYGILIMKLDCFVENIGNTYFSKKFIMKLDFVT